MARSALLVRCPTCGAKPGTPCRDETGSVSSHAARQSFGRAGGGKLKTRFECPRCGGPHPLADCEQPPPLHDHRLTVVVTYKAPLDGTRHPDENVAHAAADAAFDAVGIALHARGVSHESVRSRGSVEADDETVIVKQRLSPVVEVAAAARALRGRNRSGVSDSADFLEDRFGKGANADPERWKCPDCSNVNMSNYCLVCGLEEASTR